MAATMTSLPVGEQSAATLLGHARDMIDPILHAAVESLPHPLDLMAGYHFGWTDADGAPTLVETGKGLRPALTFGAATACHADPEAAAHAAAAVELVHNFSLVHDDLMDADPIRHGRPTVWHLWGATNATLLGDGLQALAVGILADGVPDAVVGEAVARLARAMITLCGGQTHDCAFETRSSVTVGEYLSMAAGKTGALFGCACALGALCAGSDPFVVARMNTFGRELGVAFQLIDDVIGIWGDPQTTGKPVGSDLVRRKQSFPVIWALTSDTAAAKQLSALYRGRGPMTASDVAAAKRFIEKARSLERTLEFADERMAAALTALPPEAAVNDLEVLAHFVAQRNR